ncbi:hypothetical protein EJD97_014909 [Solanum chilense]|uniref:Uncharacterized protein n=1 Tax=Solanum chilense TaxID=4083 RepID=A0A6N2AF67_SOLCI|nr:hypothetical protein EJD97_014909 [Solanum chilense]
MDYEKFILSHKEAKADITIGVATLLMDGKCIYIACYLHCFDCFYIDLSANLIKILSSFGLTKIDEEVYMI